MWRRTLSILVALFTLGLVSSPALATDYSSSSFILRDPVITAGGLSASSTNFQYFSTTGQAVIGESTATDYTLLSGFEYYATASSPVVIATAGNAQVSLSWTTSLANLGATVTSYAVGQATSSGGPYTFSDVGNVLSSLRTSLSNGTTYYFVVQARDAEGQGLAQSAQVSATPTAPPSGGGGQSSGGGGGGGGGGAPSSNTTTTTVNFSGRAYPESKVTLLRDAQMVKTTTADDDATFDFTLSGVTAGNYFYAVYAEDSAGRRSSLVTLSVTVKSGQIANVAGVFIPPTLVIDQTEVKAGDALTISGQSVPGATVTVLIGNEEPQFVQAIADDDGIYSAVFDTAELANGQYLVKALSTFNQEISGYSASTSFAVGEVTVPVEEGAPPKSDINGDARVNLVDFSIIAFWYGRALDVEFLAIEAEALSGDGKIDLVDLSILAFYWTG